MIFKDILFNKKICIESFFVIFAFFFGVMLIFLTPPLQSPDEPAHFSRAYSVSEGHFIAKKMNNVSGDYVPLSLFKFENSVGYLTFKSNERISYDILKKSSLIALEKENKVFGDQKYQALYSAISYLPQSIGIFIFRHFIDSVYWILIGGKLFLLIFYIVCGVISIKSIPFLKELLFLVLLMPMSLSLGASVSADGVLISLSILYISKIIEYSFSSKKLNSKQYLFLLSMALLIALVKQSFFISLFILFLPMEKLCEIRFPSCFNNNFSKITAIVLPAFLIGLFWSKISYNIFVPLNGSNPSIQLLFILSHPFVYLHTLFYTLYLNFLILIYETIGILGWLDVFLFPITYWLYFFFLFLNTFVGYSLNQKFESSSYQKLFLFIYVVFNVIFTSTAIYLSWIRPYVISPFEGLQGRYFIPFVLPFFVLLFLLFNSFRSIFRFKYIFVFNIVLVILTYLNLVFGLYIRYYANF